ncbi:UDP-N-acetylglucosamine 4-epimerase [Echinicola strongylocentroti]|uniref:UDP-N-acetylglucosamine 4-epimerase n=1 Tax=Echinicola strongylocentroti TaxID=1795355 RepID=A0A2Z4IPF1_9BACT|nr:NAD-dependent epimerase/dehydratase family protein [Echinicola strongylocentroti]AWW32233.1 UDP-N-acetylglucosamine 4-epimerase [Echinicola strongylocentroti]
MQEKKINIIGGSGFIGTRLCKRLTNSDKIFEIFDKNQSKSFPNLTTIVDVRDKDLIDLIQGGTIINLAAEHRDDVTPISLYDEVNVDGARRVCEAAEKKGVNQIIFTSSVAVYGFGPIGIDESGEINYFNDYGRTKFLAEEVYREWQAKDTNNRSLVIIRPTVVFGEQNRGNVYNLLKQIALGKFVMVGSGENVKSMAYVENVAAFLEYAIDFKPGVHLYNYIDKPDFTMNVLVKKVFRALGKSEKIGLRIPYPIGYGMGKILDLGSKISGKKLPISSIRVKKFCSNTCFNTNIEQSGFKAPVSIEQGLAQTLQYEFVEKKEGELFYSE